MYTASSTVAAMQNQILKIKMQQVFVCFGILLLSVGMVLRNTLVNVVYKVEVALLDFPLLVNIARR
jgi:hypothetical protein